MGHALRARATTPAGPRPEAVSEVEKAVTAARVERHDRRSERTVSTSHSASTLGPRSEDNRDDSLSGTCTLLDGGMHVINTFAGR